MRNPNEIFRLLRPLLKRWYLIVACCSIGLVLAFKASYYRKPVYEATTIIKLDNTNHGVSDMSLYKSFDIFAQGNKTANEVELIRSKSLIIQTLKKLDFSVEYFRKGKIKTIELYKERPFLVEVIQMDSSYFDHAFIVSSTNGKDFTLSAPTIAQVGTVQGAFDSTVQGNGFVFKITVNKDFIDSDKKRLLLSGNFEVYFRTYENLATQFGNENFFVRSPDKEIDIIYFSYKHEIPEKAQAFVNAHAHTYIEDGISFKERAAKNTVDFIKKELKLVDAELKAAEMDIANFKRNFGIINTRQETQAGINKVSQLELQAVGLKIKEEEVIRIAEHLKNNADDAIIAPNYESVLDPVFIDRLSSLNKLKLEKGKQLLKLQPQNNLIISMKEQISELTQLLKESIDNTLRSIKEEKESIRKAIADALQKFESLPEKERRLIDLERRFRLKEKMYSFLAEKKLEAEILSKARVSFHRVISEAELPKYSTTPSRTFILIIIGLVSIAVSVFISYLLDYLKPIVGSREELESHLELPVVGVLPIYSKLHRHCQEALSSMTATLIIKRKIQKGQAVCISSTVQNEGKTFVAYHLSKTLSDLGWKVLLVDFDIRKPSMHSLFNTSNRTGMVEYLNGDASREDIIQKTDVHNVDFIASGKTEKAHATVLAFSDSGPAIEALKEGYDVLIYDTSPSGMTVDTIPIMKNSDLNLYVVRANMTNRRLLANPLLLQEEYGIINISMILNGTSVTRYYSGYYMGDGKNSYKFFSRIWIRVSEFLNRKQGWNA